MNIKEIVHREMAEAFACKEALRNDSFLLEKILAAGDILLKVAAQNRTIFSCGNGGSACDAMHFAEELIARFERERKGVRARHLLDIGTISCWANDYSYEDVFARQVKTLCDRGDVLVGFSTSGNSQNVIRAFEEAKRMEVYTIGLLGKSGGRAAEIVDLPIVVPADSAHRAQELHITIVHVWCELIDVFLSS
ncbi:MAG TPA: SIS domain-containing protein [Oligoflexia bacterium]|nr:SIS domain-containing protein [Oligoflexia bacterium]HMP27085.1 SIS domain-containing protein [Oligoflexia bacterium]